MDGTRKPQPSETETLDAFTPEAAEIEPAGGIVSRPPVPEQGEPPTEGDRR